MNNQAAVIVFSEEKTIEASLLSILKEDDLRVCNWMIMLRIKQMGNIKNEGNLPIHQEMDINKVMDKLSSLYLANNKESSIINQIKDIIFDRLKLISLYSNNLSSVESLSWIYMPGMKSLGLGSIPIIQATMNSMK